MSSNEVCDLFETSLLYLSNQFCTESSLQVKCNMKVTPKDKVGIVKVMF